MPKILIIDDDTDLLEVLQSMIASRGFETATATNGISALKTIEELTKSESPISLVLSDLHMPQMNGRELLIQLRSSKFQNLPVIIMSGNIDPPMVRELAVHEVDSIIFKPFDIEKLIHEMQSAIKRRRAIEEKAKFSS